MEKGRIGTKQVITAKQLKKYANEPVYRTCHHCGRQMEGRHGNREYPQCGLSNVVLLDVLIFSCACGEIAVELPAIALLHRFIAFELLRKPALLSGEEIRFLRKFVGYSAMEFAEVIGTTNVSISRWEGKGRITKNTDRVLRLAFFTAMIEKDAEIAIGPDCGTHVAAVVEFAKRVKSFNLTAFLKTIRDETERHIIKVDPQALAELGRSENVIRQGTPNCIQ